MTGQEKLSRKNIRQRVGGREIFQKKECDCQGDPSGKSRRKQEKLR